MKEEYKLTATREVIDHALNSGTDKISDEMKEKLATIKESGYLERTQKVVDHDVEKEIDRYYDEEIKKAQDRGELPKIKTKRLKSIKKIHDRKQQRK